MGHGRVHLFKLMTKQWSKEMPASVGGTVSSGLGPVPPRDGRARSYARKLKRGSRGEAAKLR